MASVTPDAVFNGTAPALLGRSKGDNDFRSDVSELRTTRSHKE